MRVNEWNVWLYRGLFKQVAGVGWQLGMALPSRSVGLRGKPSQVTTCSLKNNNNNNKEKKGYCKTKMGLACRVQAPTPKTTGGPMLA